MKKKILFVAVLFTGSLAFAQGTTTSIKNSRGLEYLPQAGDWAIQFDAAPGLTYLGSAFSSDTGAVSPGAQSPFGNSTFVGKKFISATEAYRVKLGINYSVGKDESDTLVRTNKMTNLVLGFGKEWRRGHNRLQGFYGIEGLISLGSPTATTSIQYNDTLTAGRTLGVTRASSFGIGARGFIGVEYFVMPKISIGGEFGWGIGYQTSSFTVSNEGASSGDAVVDVESKNSGFAIQNDNGGSIFGGSAALNLTFHF